MMTMRVLSYPSNRAWGPLPSHLPNRISYSYFGLEFSWTRSQNLRLLCQDCTPKMVPELPSGGWKDCRVLCTQRWWWHDMEMSALHRDTLDSVRVILSSVYCMLYAVSMCVRPVHDCPMCPGTSETRAKCIWEPFNVPRRPYSHCPRRQDRNVARASNRIRWVSHFCFRILGLGRVLSLYSFFVCTVSITIMRPNDWNTSVSSKMATHTSPLFRRQKMEDTVHTGR